MSKTTEQGRYARMVMFWGITLLVGYGCFHGGGLVTVLDRTILPASANPTLVEQFPLVGSLKVSTLIAMALVGATMLAVRSFSNRARVNQTLIDTESEMLKVTWPTWGETWSGTVAVAVMVAVLFGFLTLIDVLLAEVMRSLLGSFS